MSDKCTCGRICVGTIRSEHKNVDEKCPLHGYGTETYNNLLKKYNRPVPERIDTFDKKKCYPYQVNGNDSEYGEDITWSIYGHVPTNELIVIAKTKNIDIKYKIKSSIISPPMVDRIFGIDVGDSKLAMWLADYIWILHEKELVESI